MTQQRDTYPLKWPDGWKRTTAAGRRRAPYKVSREAAVRELLGELRKMAARDVVVSSNLRTGLVKDSESEVKDPGVAVYWLDPKGEARVLACDHWERLRDNVRAISLTLNSLRQISRCGASAVLDRALEGFRALPAARDCWSILGLPSGATKTAIGERFRELSLSLHPDRGGDAATYAETTRAYHDALKGAGGP